MQQQTVVIVAQSGRFLAQIANAAGYSVRVADCFGDQDTLAVAEHWVPLPSLDNHRAILDAIITLGQGKPCLLLYGSGVEAFYSILDRLPKTITVAGNTADQIEQVKNPRRFFSLLQQLSISYPETHFSPPDTNNKRWLCKPNFGFGGQFIIEANQLTGPDSSYYQRYIEGLNGSVLFLADGHCAEIYCFNQQFQSTTPTHPFLLTGLSSPHDFSPIVQQKITEFVKRIVRKTGLQGFNSLDFIAATNDDVFVLEINPRLSASAELINVDVPLFKYHLAACLDHTLLTGSKSSQNRHLHTVFSPTDILIPDNIDWPSFCHDIPQGQTSIEKNAPICTVIIETSCPFIQSQNHVEHTVFSLLGLLENQV